jgi:hypothetical protein
VEHFRIHSQMTPQSKMPPYNLPDANMAALTAYMLSLKGYLLLDLCLSRKNFAQKPNFFVSYVIIRKPNY